MRKIVLSLGLVLGLSYLMPEEVSATTPFSNSQGYEVVVVLDTKTGVQTTILYKGDRMVGKDSRQVR